MDDLPAPLADTADQRRRELGECVAEEPQQWAMDAFGPVPDDPDARNEDRATPFRARVSWTDPATKKRRPLSRSKASREEAEEWCDEMRKLDAGGVDPDAAALPLGSYGDLNLSPALGGLAAKTTDPYPAGWRKRVKPTLGHIPVRMMTYGAVDRAAMSWIADGCTKSVIQNSLAMLVRVTEQAYRDRLVDRNPARITPQTSARVAATSPPPARPPTTASTGSPTTPTPSSCPPGWCRSAPTRHRRPGPHHPAHLHSRRGRRADVGLRRSRHRSRDRRPRRPRRPRRDTLSRSAYALGQLVGAHALPEPEALAALENAWAAWGDDKSAAKDLGPHGVITTALAAGKANPRRNLGRSAA